MLIGNFKSLANISPELPLIGHSFRFLGQESNAVNQAMQDIAKRIAGAQLLPKPRLGTRWLLMQRNEMFLADSKNKISIGSTDFEQSNCTDCMIVVYTDAARYIMHTKPINRVTSSLGPLESLWTIC